jgi:hypothetical protein
MHPRLDFQPGLRPFPGRPCSPTQEQSVALDLRDEDWNLSRARLPRQDRTVRVRALVPRLLFLASGLDTVLAGHT